MSRFIAGIIADVDFLSLLLEIRSCIIDVRATVKGKSEFPFLFVLRHGRETLAGVTRPKYLPC